MSSSCWILAGSCRVFWPRAFIVACFAVAAGQSSVAAGIVVNGSFEMPAGVGDGDVYATDPSFSLPGWTVPTGPNR